MHHKCKQLLDLHGVEVKTISDEPGEDGFYLTMTTYADQKMVDDGQASSVGEFIFERDLLISYCPFCGKILD